MGASTFCDLAVGQSARQAFEDAVTEAQYEHGHGGYTGTIAEKQGFVEFWPRSGKRWKLEQVVDLLEDCGFDSRMGVTARTARAKLVDLFGEPSARRMIELYTDKWGPAICVELVGRKATEAKKRLGVSGTRRRVYAFFGWASS